MKSSKLVESLIEQYDIRVLYEVAVIFNIKHVRSSVFGKFVKPLVVVAKGSSSEDPNGSNEFKARDENPDYFFNIPDSLIPIIEDIQDTYKYLVISIDCSTPKVYKDKEDNEYTYYDKSIAVIRNPKIIEEIEEIQKRSIVLNEYTF